MGDQFPASWATLKHPWTRRELLGFLQELTSEDPIEVWAKGRQEGSIVGFDEVIHFFFDDHDFDSGDVGFSLFDDSEIRLIEAVKKPLDCICRDLPEGDDSQSVAHPAWQQVREAGAQALLKIGER